MSIKYKIDNKISLSPYHVFHFPEIIFLLVLRHPNFKNAKKVNNL